MNFERYHNLFELIVAKDKTANIKIAELTPILIRYAMKYGADPKQAEEAVYHVLSKIVVMLHKGRLDATLRATPYLFASVRNEWFLQKKLQSRCLPVDAFDFDILEADKAADQDLLDKEDMEAFEICMNKLPQNHREILKLHLDQPDLTHHEVARRLNYSGANARTLKSRAVRHLRNLIKERTDYYAFH